MLNLWVLEAHVLAWSFGEAVLDVLKLLRMGETDALVDISRSAEGPCLRSRRVPEVEQL